VRNIVFIGGGNMAQALIGGLVKAGRPGASIVVIEPSEGTRRRLVGQFGVSARSAAGPALEMAEIIVWAVKPQTFDAAAAPCAGHVGAALQVSVMAGVRSDAIVAATGSERVIRVMPNTPALIGQGISGLYARAAVDAGDKAEVEAVLAPTGRVLWFERESDLDAVTALSGSGPAYVFFVAEAMVRAAVEMGLTEAQGRELALATLSGASALALGTTDALALLRERVTSKGGTTHAAITSLQADRVDAAFVRALHAARDRVRELGDEFG
jgi:pyrroline-5-carboxylate reductase